MAIIITNSPTGVWHPVYNYINYKVQSSGSAQTNFQYLCNVTVGGNLITTLSNAPAPDGYGYFNVARIVENYVDYNVTSLLNFAVNPGQACSGVYTDLTISFTERYGDPAVTYPSSTATASTIYAFNGALPYYDRVDWISASYSITGTNSNRFFLSEAPRDLTITRDQNFWLTFLRDSTLDGIGDKFRIYGISNGNYLYEWQVNYNINYLTSGGRMIRIPASPKLWSTVNASYVTGDTWSNISDPDIDTFQICIYNEDLDTAGSETFTIRIKPDVCRFTPKEIVFMNRYGAMESYVFQLASNEKNKVERTTYTNAMPVSQLNYTKGDVRTRVRGVNSSKDFTVLSNWLSEEESIWLEDLLKSPMVWVNDGGVLKHIILKTGEWDSYNREVKKLYQLKLDYTLSIKDDSQRG